MFQVPLLLHTILVVDRERSVLNEDMDEELSHRVKKLISATIDNRPKRRNGFNQMMSDYILFLITESLSTLVETTPKSAAENFGLGGLPTSAIT